MTLLRIEQILHNFERPTGLFSCDTRHVMGHEKKMMFYRETISYLLSSDHNGWAFWNELNKVSEIAKCVFQKGDKN